MKTSEKLIAGIGGVVLAVAATFSGIAIANPATTDNSPAKIIQEQPAVVDLEPEVTPEPTQEPVAPAPAPEPAPVVEAPAPPPPPAPPAAPSGAARGTPLPFYPSSDPQNANGGDYADPGSYCASKSGSTINGVPQCD